MENILPLTIIYTSVLVFIVVCTRATETYLKPFNTEETEHEGDVGDVVIAQRVGVQVLAGRRRGTTDKRK